MLVTDVALYTQVRQLADSFALSSLIINDGQMAVILSHLFIRKSIPGVKYWIHPRGKSK